MVYYKRKGNGDRRGFFNIVADMLGVGEVSVNKTYFMSRCNLSFKQLSDYLAYLLKIGCLEIVESSNGGINYHTTFKGYDVRRRILILDGMTKPNNGPVPNGSAAPYLKI